MFLRENSISIYRNLLILIVFLGVGFVVNVAQGDIFVRKTFKQQDVSKDKSSDDRGSSIYLRPHKDNKKDDTRRYSTKNRVNYGQRTMMLAQHRKQMAAAMRALAYWQQRDSKPQNAKELRSHAIAYSAVARGQMLKNRYAKQAKLDVLARERRESFEAEKLARTPNIEAVMKAEAKIAAYKQDTAKRGMNVYTNYGSARAQQATKKKKVIYRRAKPTGLSKPSRVIRDYR